MTVIAHGLEIGAWNTMKLAQFTPSAELAAMSNDELIDAYAGTRFIRWHIIYTLNQRTDVNALIDAALLGLKHSHPQVRRMAGDLLDHHADQRCVEPLLELMNDPVAHVRRQAVHSLSCQRCKVLPLEIEQRVTARLIDLVLHDTNIGVRCEALSAFTLRPDSATPALRAELARIECEFAAITQPSERQRWFLKQVRSTLRAMAA